jgi:hypothetical protein
MHLDPTKPTGAHAQGLGPGIDFPETNTRL